MNKTVKIPKRKVVKIPRIVVADAYTISSNLFASEEAKEKSVYYITFRRRLKDIDTDLYREGDNRIVFNGLSRIIEKLFYANYS